MKLSLRSEYALLALIHLARANTHSTLAEVAAARQIPAEPLAEVLMVLNRSDYVTRSQADGGYRLNRIAAEISVAEIIHLFDGALAPLEPVSSKGYVLAPMDKEEKLAGLFEQINEQIAAQLENTTIAGLA